MIIIFMGNGKGKTTAALGQMVRVLGRGKNASMIQFIKGPWESGEDKFAEIISRGNPSTSPGSPAFKLVKMGKGFVGILGDKLPREEHQKAAEEALTYFKKELASGKWHLIVLDEVNVATSLGLLKAKDVLDALKNVPEERLVILTGRGAPQEFIDRADLVTEMREIKHPFNDKKLAKVLVEF